MGWLRRCWRIRRLRLNKQVALEKLFVIYEDDNGVSSGLLEVHRAKPQGNINRHLSKHRDCCGRHGSSALYRNVYLAPRTGENMSCLLNFDSDGDSKFDSSWC